MSNQTNKSKEETPKEMVKVFLRDDGIIEFKIVGRFNEQMAEEIMEKVKEEEEIIGKLPDKVKLFSDISQLEISKGTGWSSSVEIRKTGIRLMKREKIEKIAILGKPTSSFIKVAVAFMFQMTGLKKAKYFEDKDEAIKWLKE